MTLTNMRKRTTYSFDYRSADVWIEHDGDAYMMRWWLGNDYSCGNERGPYGSMEEASSEAERLVDDHIATLVALGNKQATAW